MPWGAAIAGAGAIGSSLIGSSGAKSAAKNAQLKSFTSESPLGSAQLDKKGHITGQAGIGSELADGFLNFGKNALGGLNTAPSGIINFDPNSLLDIGKGGSAGSDPYRAAGLDALGAGKDMLAAFKNFDPNAFAMQQFARLNALSAPGEATAASSTANQLFGAGRAGPNDSHAGEVFRNLDLSQRQARDSRLLSSLGLAQTEQQGLYARGTGLLESGTNTGIGAEQIHASEIQRLLAGITGATNVGGFESNMRQSLLGQATGAQAGISNAYSGAQQAIQNALAGGTASANAGANAAQIQVAGSNQVAANLGEAAGAFGTAVYKRNTPQKV